MNNAVVMYPLTKFDGALLSVYDSVGYFPPGKFPLGHFLPGQFPFRTISLTTQDIREHFPFQTISLPTQDIPERFPFQTISLPT